MPAPVEKLDVGSRVMVIQQIPQRDEVWTTRLTGEIVKVEQQKTGSWFARAKDDRLWLDRLMIKKDDGEIVWVNLDQYTRVEPVSGGAASAPKTAAAPTPASTAGADSKPPAAHG